MTGNVVPQIWSIFVNHRLLLWTIIHIPGVLIPGISVRSMRMARRVCCILEICQRRTSYGRNLIVRDFGLLLSLSGCNPITGFLRFNYPLLLSVIASKSIFRYNFRQRNEMYRRIVAETGPGAPISRKRVKFISTRLELISSCVRFQFGEINGGGRKITKKAAL